ncbi:wd40-repeat protein [Nannochloropsis oceanica]
MADDAPINVEQLRFQVVDKDTGQVFRIDEMEQHININAYTLFPSRDELAQRLASSTAGQGGEDSDDESTSSPGSGLSAAGLSALSSMLGFTKRKSVQRQDTIEGQVRVSTVKKDGPDFGDLKVSQCLQAHDGPIWTMKFSLRGEFLASAGQSGVVYVWTVGGAGPSGAGGGEEAPVTDEASVSADVIKLLRLSPHRRFRDHTADVIDLSWNKENFLLSASIDKTVRLWHTARAECLHVYPHVDCVTSVHFHPKIDHLFLSGNFDKKLRVWNVTDGRVKEWANTPDMITAACFNPEGTMAVAGLYRGQVFFYQAEGMKYYTQVECRNRHGALKGGKKVTGLCYDTSSQHKAAAAAASLSSLSTFGPSTTGGNNTNSSSSSSSSVVSSTGILAGGAGSEQLLITTNDSRLRLYQTEDYSMLCKYKGLTNDHMQIKATFSEDGEYVISGSENGQIYIWKGTTPQQGAAGGLAGLSAPLTFKKDRNTAYEFFPATEIGGANPPIVSVALFVPAAAVMQSLKGTRHEEQWVGVGAGAAVSKMIIAADYSGKIRVFQRHSLTVGSSGGTSPVKTA